MKKFRFFKERKTFGMTAYLIINLFILLFIFNFLYSSSWQALRFDYQRTGAKYEVAIPSPTPVGWSIEIQGEIVASPILKDDIVYFASRDNSIWALNAYTGEILWQYSTSGRIDCTPVVWNNYVYVLSFDGKLYCFKKYYSSDEDCVPLWTYDTQSKSVSSPIIIEDEEIVGEEKNPWIIFVSGPKIDGVPYGKLYILDAITGSLIKQIDLGSFSYSSVSYSDGKIYFTTNDGVLRCYDLKTQQFLWTKMFSSCFNQTSVAVKEDKIYLYAGDIERSLYVLDKTNGEILWSTGPFTNIATDNNSVAVFEDKILVNIYPTSLWEKNSIKYSSQTVLCISTVTKQILWREDFTVVRAPEESYNITSAVSVCNNIGFFGTYDNKFYAINILTGEVLAEYNFSSPIVCSPAISNGWMYFSEVSGEFHSIKLDKFLSIKLPDYNEVVINLSTITIITSGYEDKNCNLELYKGVEISTSIALSLSTTTKFLFDTQGFLDGIYSLNLKINGTTYVMNNFVIDNSPLPPTNIRVETPYKINKILLRWDKSLDDGFGNNDVKKYNIYRSLDGKNYSFIASVPKGVDYYVDTLYTSATYYYKIVAKDRHSESIYYSPVSIFVSAEGVTGETYDIKKDSHCVVEYSYNNRKVELEFFKDSLESDITITISIPEDYSLNFPKDTKFTNIIYKFWPSVKFKSAVKLRIYYNDEDVKNINENKLRICWYDERNNIWRIVDTSKVNSTKNYVEADIYQFSIYALVEYSPEDKNIFKPEYAYTFPSPAKGDKVYFKFLLFQPAKVKVYVYDVVGDLLWQSQTYEFTEADIGKTHLISWDIKSIATGMYIFRLEGKNSNKRQNVIKKFAIIH